MYAAEHPQRPLANVLLVDGNPASLLELRSSLESFGHNLVEARSGEEALRRLQDDDYAVILLDVELAGGDGFAIARRIRNQPRCQRTPIIFISHAACADFPVADAYALGAVDCLAKPLDPVVMRAKLAVFAELFDQARAARQHAEQLHLMIEGTRDYAIFMLDPDGYVISWNTGAERFSGYRAEEIIGQHFSRFYPPKDVAAGKPARELREAVATGKYEEEGWRVRKDGSYYWASVLITTLHGDNGVVRGFSKVTRDVTDRRAAELALRESEERFRLLVEGTRDCAIFMLDPQGKVLTWNPGADRIIGYRAEEIIGQHFSRLYPPEDVAAGKTERALQHALASGKYEEEGWRLRKDGSRFWSSVIITPLLDEAGNVRGFSKVTRDMTARKQAEENERRLLQEEAARKAAEAGSALARRAEAAERAQREHLNATLQAIGDAVIATDAGGRVTLLNPVAEALTGWRKGEAIGKPLDEVFCIVNEQTGARAASPVAEALEKGVIVGLANHTVLVDRHGRRRPIDDSAAPIRDDAGNVIGVILVFRDISTRRKAEETYRFLADASATLAAIIDYQSTLQKVARLAVPYFADWCTIDMIDESGTLRRLAATHVDPAKVSLAHEAYRRWPPDPDAPHGVWKVIRSGQSEFVPEITDAMLEERLADRELVDMVRQLGFQSYLAAPLKAHDRVRGVITFIAAESGRHYDATDLAIAEDLAHRATVAIENAELYRELTEAHRNKDEFLAMLAHELRNPLAPIRNGLQILRMRGVDAATAERAREIMERQLHSLIRLVDDLLDVSRIMQGKIELRKERIDLAAVVARAIETAQPMIDAGGHEFEISLPPEPLWLEGDLVRLAQVVTNLLHNCAKYMEPNGHIWLSAKRDGELLELRVRDTGIGIEPDLLPRIFELFVQAEHGMKRSKGGLGIGLTLVHRLVQMHGGTIAAHSEGLGKGAEFIIRLPVLSLWTQPKTPAVAAEVPALKVERRVLVVDDNEDAAASLGTLLRLQGQRVWVAHSGAAALKIASECRPELVFLDIGMPGMDGYEVARRLRGQSNGHKVVLVALTGWGQEEDRRRSREAGFDHHVIKPVEPDTLRNFLASIGD